MPKRGKYFKYLFDDKQNVPRSTLCRKRKLENSSNNEDNSMKNHSSLNLKITTLTEVNAQNFVNDSNEVQTSIESDETHINQLNRDTVLDPEDIQGCNAEVVSEFDHEDKPNYFNINLNDEHSKEDLCAASLAFFFSGKMTQHHFLNGIKFFNTV